MQTSLGRKGDYSVRAMLRIATSPDRRQKAREISEEMSIPRRYVSQILADLVQNDLLTAMAGPTGGYCLARPAADISLLDIVEASEGAIALDQCVLQGGPCTWVDSCPIHIPWARAQQAMADHLATISVADLAVFGDEIDSGTHVLPADTPPHTIPTRRKSARRSEKEA